MMQSYSHGAWHSVNTEEVRLARSWIRTLKLPRCWQNSGRQKDLEPDAKAFRHPGGEDGRGWYYRIAHASKKRIFRKDSNSGLEKIMESEGDGLFMAWA